MLTLILCFLLPQLIVLPVYLCAYQSRRERTAGDVEKARVMQEKAENDATITQELKRAYFGLKKQKAAGFGPWLAACIEKVTDGEEVPVEVACMALDMTLRDIREWTDRWDLSCVTEARGVLGKIMEGEG